MQWIKRWMRHSFHCRRGFLRRTQPVGWLRIILQGQCQKPRIVLATQFRSDTKAEINPRSNAASGDAVTVLHYTVDDELGSKLRQDVTDRPMGCRFVAAQKTGRTENHRSCADARHELRSPSTPLQKLEGFAVRHERHRAATAASYKQDVHRIRTIGECFGSLDGDARVAFHGALRLGDKLHVYAREIAKNLLRPYHIERSHAWINQHRDLCRFLRHGLLLAASVLSMLLCIGHLGEDRAQS